MSNKSRFLSATLNFGFSQVLGVIASLVSFPILARMLTISEYGVLGLCNTTLLLGCAFAKMGLQNSIVRFYPEYRSENKLDTFFATFVWGGGGFALLISLILVPVSLLIAPPGFKTVFLVIIPVVFVQSFFSTISNFLRSEERSSACAISTVIVRYVGTFGGIALIYFAGAGLVGIFSAQFVIYAILLLFYLKKYHTEHTFSIKKFSMATYLGAAAYGFPLIVFELSSIVLAFSDRYLINIYCGPGQLGIYTAVYTICFYLADMVRQPLQLAVMPVYLRILHEDGKEKTVEFIRDVIGYVFLVILPLFAGCVAFGDELVIFLASSKYAVGAGIVPWVLGSSLLYSLQSLVAVGFYIKKRTKLFSGVLFVGGSVNILMNITLIPTYGIIAAAWATAVSYILVLAVLAIISNKMFRISLPYLRISVYGFCAFSMYFLLLMLHEFHILAKTGFGVIAYVTLVLLLDRKLYTELTMFLKSKLTVAGHA